MSILEFKTVYNNLIYREKKAEKYFDDPLVEQFKKDNWLNEFNKIIISLSLLLIEYKKITGCEMPNYMVLNGFE